MEKEKIFIKNMVCNRCIMVVESELKKLGINYTSVSLGEVQLTKPLDEGSKDEFKKAIEPLGFSLIDNRRGQLIEQVKNTIIDLIYNSNNNLRINLSDYISEKTHYDYNYISNLFSEIEGTTIKKYFIAQKTERVKELLVYNELTLSEIADMLNYSSVAHLSSQFKKVTGLTPSHFKQIGENKRKPLDKL